MVNLDWKQEENNKKNEEIIEKENEFYHWIIETWYEEHVKCPKRMIAEIEYTESIYSGGTKRVSKVIVRIVPYQKKVTNGLLVLDEKLSQSASDNLINIFFLLSQQFNYPSREMILCYLVFRYILHYDWIKSSTSKEFFFDILDSESEHNKLMTVEEILNPFFSNGYTKKHDVGFDSLIKTLYTHGKSTESFDLIPPGWFKYLPTYNELIPSSEPKESSKEYPDPETHTLLTVWTKKDMSLNISTSTDGKKDGQISFKLVSGKMSNNMKLMNLLINNYPRKVKFKEILMELYPNEISEKGKREKLPKRIQSLVNNVRDKLSHAGINPDIIPYCSHAVLIGGEIGLQVNAINNLDEKHEANIKTGDVEFNDETYQYPDKKFHPYDEKY
ncbi:hypothetical protein HOC54_02855 [Candidatus Peregrinibacteria bacterium]|jgi:hypothetical protein|nr:hypothetical protein [Candidatus Peregrinibacteria bacterium]